MFRTWHLMGAIKDVLLVHGRGPTPEGAELLTPELAAWHLATWAADDSLRPILHDVGNSLGSFRGSPAHPDSDELLVGLLHRSLTNGSLRAFFWAPPVFGGPGPLPPPPPAPPPPAPLLQVNPIIKPATTVVVVVKTAKDPKTGTTGPYTHPKRRAVTLTTDIGFDGTGTFTCDKPALVKFFTAAVGGTEVKFDGKDNVFKGAALTGGVTVFAEGQKPSGGMDDITLTLSLSGGSKPTGPDDKATVTSVEVTLDICKPPAAAGAAPVPLSQDDKIFVGRNVLVQDAKNHFDRAQLILQPVKPASFKGDLVLKAINGDVTVFRDEKPKAGEAALLPYTIGIDKVGAGDKLWVQGVGPSADMRSTGFTLGIKGVEDEGDKVAATAVQITLDICKSRTTTAADPAPLSADDKVKVGRFVHEQDAKNHHGRALLVVRKVKPEKFDGTLVLRSTGAHTELFPNERPTGGEAATAAPHEIDYSKEKNEDKKLWVQGKTVSGALRDAGYFLHVKGDLQTNADTVLLTVCKFSHLKADIPSTPAATNRLGNSPVNRHSFERVGNPDDFDEDSNLNKAFALVEGSVLATDDAHKILLTVQVAPAGTPVLWSVQRDKRPAPNGDHATIAALPVPARPVADAADKLKARMIADGVGTFHIRPFVDCNGSGDFDHQIDFEPYIIMNMVLIRVKGHTNISVAQPANASAAITGAAGGAPSSANGVGVSTGNFAAPGTNAAVHQVATVTVTGGGNDGKRGLDMLFGGWVNNETTVPGSTTNGEDVVAIYQQTFPPPPPPAPPLPPVNHPRSSLWVAPASPKLYRPPAAAPAGLAGPLLDTTNFGAEGTGGNRCVGTEGRVGPPNPPGIVKTNLAVGQRWTIEMWDSPGDSAPPAHEGFPGTLVSYRFNLDFRTDLVFWTNNTKVPGPTATDPANRLYSSVQTNRWTIRVALAFNPATGAPIGAVPANATVVLTKDGNPTRLAAPVEGLGLETRGPVSLNMLAIDASR